MENIAKDKPVQSNTEINIFYLITVYIFMILNLFFLQKYFSINENILLKMHFKIKLLHIYKSNKIQIFRFINNQASHVHILLAIQIE